MAGATFPDDTALGGCVLVPMRRGLVPFVAGALRMYEAKSYWATRDDYERAYNAFVELQMVMLNNCLTQLVEGQDRLYRLWDTALNGTQYAETEPGVITPPIPAVPDASTSAPNALRAQVGRMSHIMENAATGATFSEGAGIEGAPALPEELSWSARLLAVQGETPGGIFGIGAKPVQLLDLLKAGRINDQSDKDKLKSAIDQVDSALDVGTDLGTFIKSFLDSAAELGTDGGAIATQLVIGAATNRALQRLIFSLDGGNPIRPGDNVLRALRGDVEATADRNVIDAIGAPWVDPAGEQTPFALLASINQRLETLRSTLRGSTSGPDISDQLQEISLRLSGLVKLDDQNETVVGGALAVVTKLLDCICEGVNGTSSTPPPAGNPQYVPSACDADNFPVPIAQSVGLSFVSSNTNSFVEMAFPNGSTLEMVGPTSGNGGNTLRSVTAATDVCVQLWIDPSDPGGYSVEINGYTNDGIPNGFGNTQLDVPPNPGAQTTLIRTSNNGPVYYRITVTRVTTSDPSGVLTWSGVQPVLFLGGQTVS